MSIYKCKEFEMGINRATPTQIKKHYCQMATIEKQYVVKAVRNFNPNRLIVSPHLYEKMVKQGITFGMDIIKDTLKNFDVETDLIEVNYNDDKSTRIAFKSRKNVKVNVNGRLEDCKLCFVVNLKNNHLVTIYYNTLHNVKRIPNLNRNYDKYLNIIKHLKQYI